MSKRLKGLVKRHKRGEHVGVYSVCSANEQVIRASLKYAKEKGTFALIESTANQVNQFGGYTGMRPHDFAGYVHALARECGLEKEQVLLGGDHLGPLAWVKEENETAMRYASDLIRDYITAGYQKIHIDTSMRLAEDDKNAPLETDTIARRAALLFETAAKTLSEQDVKEEDWPCFVIGSEVPVPGGAQEEELHVQVTKPLDLADTIKSFERALKEKQLDGFWPHIIAVVVQPGVEFSDTSVRPYDKDEAAPLTNALKQYPGLVFEGHSTDYQPKGCLWDMVEDGICVLKVGPALTFAYREALFALDSIEMELAHMHGRQPVALRQTLEKTMWEDPKYWKAYYHGSKEEQAFKLVFSLSDRLRYYLPYPVVNETINRLMDSLRNSDIPFSLLSQYLPIQAAKVRDGLMTDKPDALAQDYISEWLAVYQHAISE
ncbi:MAG: class II D-tagatose-bisphosphate aldolase, non-catalytic subunit [Clostridiales bacterium]|jgi:D-tagatose-1,6-bisphosphate aldolase subunit GatZ/KbaZ|nr:class II D-tagatose-bisphosphate aldolase, non-catalytic subunit [Clostridiales bacterium]